MLLLKQGMMRAIASIVHLFGLKPKEHLLKVDSKIGSRIILKAS